LDCTAQLRSGSRVKFIVIGRVVVFKAGGKLICVLQDLIN
jgi:hypothetical protein